MVIGEKILAKSQDNRKFTAKVLSELIRIPSLSGDEKRVIKHIEEILGNICVDEIFIDRLGSLVARVGDGPKKLAFDAHIDTVDTGDLSQWDYDPYSGEVTATEVLGRGSVDQKGGAAAMITAAKMLKDLDYKGKFSVYFVFSVMEEDCDGMCWRSLIEKEDLIPDYAVLTEPTNLKVARGHRGRMEMDVIFHGKSSHGSMPHLGDNAIYKASRAALEIEKLNDNLKHDEFLGKGTIAVTHIDSESPSMCAVPDKSRFHIDRRLTAGENEHYAVSEVEQAVGENAEVEVPVYNRKGYKGNSHPQKMYFPTWTTDENHPLVKAGVRTFRELFKKSPEVGKWIFSTNGVAISGVHGITCIGFGPGDEQMAHAPNEKIKIDHLEKASAFYALLPYILEGETNE